MIRDAQFTTQLFGRAAPCVVVFDVLRVEGRDMCALPLLERRALLADLVPASGARVARISSVPQHGRASFKATCEHDLEGIVAKWTHGRYETNGTATSWIKVKNPTYSHAEGRHELFEQRRQGHSRPVRRELVLRWLPRPRPPWPRADRRIVAAVDLEFVRVFAHSPWAYVLGSAFASIPAVIWFVDTLWLRRQTRRDFHASELWALGKLVPKTPEQIEAARVAPRPVMPSYTPRLVLSALAIVALAGLGAGAVGFIRLFIRPPLP